MPESIPPIEIDISNHCDQWPAFAHKIIQTAIEQTYNTIDIPSGEVSVVLADNDFVQNLNKQYRDKDKPTNVLSFPNTPPLFGDIIFAYETVIKESEHQKKSFEDHLTHLTIHGFLHLLGYDHIDDDDAIEMESLEIEILEQLNIKNPYEIP